MQQHARLVIIGAGIAGISTCYHLVQLGWRDIVVIDQGPLFRTGGSTSHAPGGMFQTNPSKWMVECASYTVDLFSKLEYEGQHGGVKAGGIEFAQTSERLEELKRRAGLAKISGLEPEILTPSECQQLVPIIDKSQILAGLYIADDMIGNALVAASAMASYAKEYGVEFHGQVCVQEIVTKNAQVKQVVTDKGTIHCDQVLVCAGIWGPKIADLVGESFPMQPMQHQYVKTKPLPELAEASNNGTLEIAMPLLRNQDKASYFRMHYDSWGMGNYYHAPIPIDAHDILTNEQSKDMASIRDFTPEHYGRFRDEAETLFPAVRGVALNYQINGMFSFTADGMPLMGESQKVKGFWVCEGVWITHSGGIGRSMAMWLDQGRPQDDVHEGDFSRFHPHQKNKRFALARGKQAYREVYDIVHPNQQMEFPRGLRRSPFYQAQKNLGAEFFEAAGWERPQWYGANRQLTEHYYADYHHQRKGWEARYWSPIEIGEHLHTRSHAAMYDLSAFSKFEIAGKDALKFLQRLCVNQIDVAVNKVVYTSLVNQYGGIEADLTVTRLAEDRFWVLTGGGSGPQQLAWIESVLKHPNQQDCQELQIHDLSSQYAALGLWGPKARSILQQLCAQDLSNENFPFYTHRELTLGYIPVHALRLSFVGELGWEIYCPSEYGGALWESIWQAGVAHQLIAAGAGAFDSLRMEKGFLNWGSDLKPVHDPFQANLGWTVKLNKPKPFVGQQALEQFLKEPKSTRLCCLSLDSRHVVLGKEPVIHDNQVVGYVTSANTGYSVNQHLALAYLPTELSEIGSRVEVEYFAKRYPAEVVAPCQYDPKNLSMRS